MESKTKYKSPIGTSSNSKKCSPQSKRLLVTKSKVAPAKNVPQPATQSMILSENEVVNLENLLHAEELQMEEVVIKEELDEEEMSEGDQYLSLDLLAEECEVYDINLEDSGEPEALTEEKIIKKVPGDLYFIAKNPRVLKRGSNEMEEESKIEIVTVAGSGHNSEEQKIFDGHSLMRSNLVVNPPNFQRSNISPKKNKHKKLKSQSIMDNINEMKRTLQESLKLNLAFSNHFKQTYRVQKKVLDDALKSKTLDFDNLSEHTAVEDEENESDEDNRCNGDMYDINESIDVDEMNEINEKINVKNIKIVNKVNETNNISMKEMDETNNISMGQINKTNSISMCEINEANNISMDELNETKNFNLMNRINEIEVNCETFDMNKENEVEDTDEKNDISEMNEINKDFFKSVLICQIEGSSKFPRIKRIFSHYSKKQVQTIFENSSLNELQIIQEKDVVNKLIAKTNESKASSTKYDAKFCEQFVSSGKSSNDLAVPANKIGKSRSPGKRKYKSEKKSCETSEPVEFFEVSNNVVVHASGESADLLQRLVESTLGDTFAESHYSEDCVETMRKKSVQKTTGRLRSKAENKVSVTIDGMQIVEPKSHSIPELEVLPFVEDLSSHKPLISINDKSEESLREEIAVRAKDSKIRYECDYCHNFFSSKYSVRDHIFAKHPPPDVKKFYCNLCSASYVRKSNLNEHVRMIHLPLTKFECPSCQKTFKRKRYLEYHILRSHTDNKKFLCQFCGAGFSLIFALNEHVNYHHLNDKFKCPDCDKVYKRLMTLQVHMNKHHKNPTQPVCKYCLCVFKDSGTLQCHVEKEHYDQKPFSCELCDTRFSSKQAKSAHVKNVHKAVRNHACPVCDKLFKNRTSVNVHLSKTHSDEERHLCNLCLRYYKSKQTLRDHIVSQHS